MIRPKANKPRFMIYMAKSNTYLKYQQEYFDNLDIIGLTVWTKDEENTYIETTNIFNLYNKKKTTN